MKRVTAGIMLILIAVFVLTGCYTIHEKKYYSDTNHFITEEAVVDNIIYDEEKDHIVFWLSEIDDAYQSSDFMIEGENARLVIERGGLEKMAKGDIIIFTSAPAYFGNGYFMPIVSLSVGGEELLGFSEGYQNLMKNYYP